jgi:hypothetical protein
VEDVAAAAWAALPAEADAAAAAEVFAAQPELLEAAVRREFDALKLSALENQLEAVDGQLEPELAQID